MSEIILGLMSFVNSVNTWYWLLAIGTLIVSLFATFLWNNWGLTVYGVVLSGTLIVGAQYIEPALMGWMNYTGFREYASFAFMVLWAIAFLQIMYNMLFEGEVVVD